MSQTAIYFSLMLAGYAGLRIALHIFNKKRQPRPLVCPFHFNCDAVVRSDFAKFLGLPVELWGIVYYSLILVNYAVLLVWPTLAAPALIFALLGLSLVAFLFSLYLTFIQAFALKQWCSWCLISAGLCVLIFGLGWWSAEIPLVLILAQHKTLLLILHLIGVSLGVGGATLADVFFFKFLKDLKISHEENSILQTISQIIWLALAVLVLTGAGLYWPEAATLNQSPQFLLKMVVVGVIIVNGALLNLIIAPRLTRISFQQKHAHEPGELHHLRRLAFALGSISLISWYSALIIALLPPLAWPLAKLVWVYLGLLAIGIIISQLSEQRTSRRQLTG